MLAEEPIKALKTNHFLFPLTNLEFIRSPLHTAIGWANNPSTRYWMQFNNIGFLTLEFFTRKWDPNPKIADARYKEKMKNGLKELVNRPAFLLSSEVIFEKLTFIAVKK